VRICVLGLLACLAVLGCSKAGSEVVAESKVTKPAAPADPDQALYDQVRSGAYQVSSAIDSIEEVRKISRTIAGHQQGATQKALLEIAASLDVAGTALADYGDEPPPFEEFKKNFAAQDDRRLKAIAAANRSLSSLEDAQDTLSDLLESHPPEPDKTELTKADSALEDCAQTLEDAVKAMGGRVPSADEAKN
jgi:hypothetical protein